MCLWWYITEELLYYNKHRCFFSKHSCSELHMGVHNDGIGKYKIYLSGCLNVIVMGTTTRQKTGMPRQVKHFARIENSDLSVSNIKKKK